jgi:phosphohistidine swiveling domain-containing protein
MLSNLTKAGTLKYLTPRLSRFLVPNSLSFTITDFRDNSSRLCNKVKEVFNGKTIIVRSSAIDEDGSVNTLAGEYDSVLNVPSDNLSLILDAVNLVIVSYNKKGNCDQDNEILIQEMISDVSMSGVVFTHDMHTGAPYYVINYDDVSGLTDTVTSGDSEYSNRTLYIYRSSTNSVHSSRFKTLLFAIQELEQVIESQFLDIEFALDKDLTPYLLQVRSITTQPNWNRAVTKQIDCTLNSVKLFVKSRFKRMSGVYGKTTVLGQMPDWNPIEMIGRTPRALAASLYQVLITDHAWRIAREKMGYMVPTGHPLMVMLAGQPFIDTRLSFHSYLPKSIPSEIGEKLVNRWVEALKSSPELHDKVEFDVAITAYSFDFDEKIEKLVGDALTSAEKKIFKEAHLQQIKRLLGEEGSGTISSALDKINILNDRNINKTNDANQLSLSSLFTMVDECIHLGTVPFAILARHGFIAKTILLSLNRIGIISNEDVVKIQEGVHTVASELVDDMISFQTGVLSDSEFMEIYGHLRPGTYDIISKRYDQMKDMVKSSASKVNHKKHVKIFEFSHNQQRQINFLLKKDSIGVSANNLLEYISKAIMAREYGKFVFTRSVSSILEFLAMFGKKNGLSREEVSHIPIDTFLNLTKNNNEKNTEDFLRKISRKELHKHEVSVAIRFPQLLTDKHGVYVIPFQVSHPNFITKKKITAPCIVLRSETYDIKLNEKIVIIEGADPGFDWIFSQNIAGLITKYGGVNSHMAIRCSEFGIPAAIGCGEQRFDMLLKSSHAHLDCSSGLINPTH